MPIASALRGWISPRTHLAQRAPPPASPSPPSSFGHHCGTARGRDCPVTYSGSAEARARCDALCSDAGTRREEPDALKTLGDAMMHGSLWAILSCGCVQAPTPNPKPQTPTRPRTRDAAHSFESAPAEALARALSVLSPCRLAKPKSRSSTASATTARVLW